MLAITYFKLELLVSVDVTTRLFFVYINLTELYDANDGWLGCSTLT
uniref:Uncharacterized protein n=1 Tax=Aegilops tauschii subsp. strangulata TaxID=200361 RepID=A0A453ESV0_AEGTS